MPRRIPVSSSGKRHEMAGTIFRLISVDGYYFIGSTTQNLTRRKSQLRRLALRPEFAHYNVIGWNNVRIEPLVEGVKDDDLKAAEIRTIQEHIYLPFCLNFKMPETRGPEQRTGKARDYYRANRTWILKKSAEYRVKRAAKRK